MKLRGTPFEGLNDVGKEEKKKFPKKVAYGCFAPVLQAPLGPKKIRKIIKMVDTFVWA